MSQSHSSLPQVTVKAVILGIILAVILAGANAYLGLFAGMTVSASIPAAVISMGVLRLFRNSNILENNIVQTAASAGEAVAAGVIFTVPALILLGYWETFDYLWVLTIAGLGGTLGVLFSVPLRRALIVEEKLSFPEGTATAKVLEVGDSGKGLKFLGGAAIAGGLAKLCETGLRLWGATAQGATYVGKGIAYFGSNLSPALLGVGYIVGFNIAALVFAGGVIAWHIAIPIYSLFFMQADPQLAALAATDASATDVAFAIWDAKIRFLGVGAMLVGGIWALVSMRNSLKLGFVSGVRGMKVSGVETAETEKDIPMQWILFGVVLMIIPIFIAYYNISQDMTIGVSLIMTLIMVVTGFLFCAVSSYMAGLVGSSNNPTSGMTIATLLFASLILLLVMGGDTSHGPAAAIMIGAIVCVAAAIGGDNLQDLKAGYLVGATPWKQQVMLIVGVVASAFVMAPILNLLLNAYGIGPADPANPNSLLAPQATLMSAVAQGVFCLGSDDANCKALPWGMVGLGAIIGVAIIALDEYLRITKANWRAPVLAVAVGIYLPLELATPIFLGGLVAWLAKRYSERKLSTEQKEHNERTGMLFAAGLITGEALIGILIAFPIIITKRSDVLAIADEPWGSIPGIIVVLALAYALYRIGTMKKQ